MNVYANCPCQANDITEATKVVYTTTPASDRGLRDILLVLLVKFKTELRAHEEFMDFVKSDVDFAVDLLDAWGGLKTPQKTALGANNGSAAPRCPHCKVNQLFCHSCETFTIWKWIGSQPACFAARTSWRLLVSIATHSFAFQT